MTGPTLRERLKPLELVAMAGVLAVFTGLIAFAGTRQWDLALIFAGIAFIAALLVLAMLALAAGSDEEVADGRPVLDRYDGAASDAPSPEAPAEDVPATGAAAAETPAADTAPAARPAADDDER